MTISSKLAALGLKLGGPSANSQLDAIPRSIQRADQAPRRAMYGHDLWNAFETSYTTPGGKPAVWHMRLVYGADSPAMVESKSLKLFLNALNNRIFESRQAFADHISTALANCVQAPVSLSFFGPQDTPAHRPLPGVNLDSYEPTRLATTVDPALLEWEARPGEYRFHSHLMRSHCPVTNQPDWAAVLVEGKGRRRPTPESLLAYLLSYRNHQAFHEACCEAIFTDLCHSLEPTSVQVSCFYTRRGGLDINPVRSTHPNPPIRDAPAWRQ